MTDAISDEHISRILIVDDTVANLRLLSDILTSQGYTVHPASDGELALELVKRVLPDLVLLDIRMPGMDGYEVCRRLKADERTQSIPIIFISMLEDESDLVKGFNAGAADYVTKPFKPEEVLARVKTHLSLRVLTVHLEQKARERTSEIDQANKELLKEVAERKRAEKELQANRLKLADAADMARIAYWEYDEASGQFVFNDAFYDIFGTTVEDEGGYRMTRKEYIARFVHPDDRERLMQEIEKNRNHPSSDRLIQYEHRAVRRDGKAIHIVARNRFVVDQDGRFIKAIGVNQDITVRKEMEDALKASEARYRAVIENSYDGMIFLDANGTIFYQTPSYSRINGYTPEERTGTSGFEFVHPDDVDEVRRRWNEELRTPGAHSTAEYRLRHKNGTWIWVETTAHNLLNNPDIRAIVITARDVTERKCAEEEKKHLMSQLYQAQRIEAVGKLAGGIAHDFNNMLAVITGHAEIAMMKADAAGPLHSHLGEIIKAANRSGDLVRQLLAFARKQTVRPRVLDLNDTVSGMLKMLRQLIGEDLNLDWMPGLDLWKVKIDPSQVDQLMANLVVNARDAIVGVGKVTIETHNVVLDKAYCRGYPESVPGQYVQVAVIDSGLGISEEVLQHIFEPFFTTKEVGKGTGLGLSTVYGIVKQNNGFIEVNSEPGKGTSFKINLPRFEAEVADVQPESKEKPVRGGTETVLLVEDEELILDMGREVLEGLGYRVLAARKPSQAIQIAGEQSGEIHLLMTDVVMPEMNGRDLAERISAIKPRLKSLYMSGYTANVIAHHGVLDKEVNFLPKPFSVKDLARKVREALDKN